MYKAVVGDNSHRVVQSRDWKSLDWLARPSLTANAVATETVRAINKSQNVCEEIWYIN